MYTFITLALILLTIIYFYSVQSNNYWKKRNVKFVKPGPFFSTQLYKFIMKPTMTEIACKIYKKFPNEDLVGYFNGRTPGLLVTNPSLIKHILVLDFEHFHDRSLEVELQDSAHINLITSRGDYWRILRKNLTPAFSINKVKKMYPLILNCANRLQKLGDKIVTKEGVTDAFEVMSRFTTEFICNCGMGVDLNIILDENSIFLDFANHAIKRTKWQNMLIVLNEIVPLPKWLRVSYFIHTKMQEFLNDIILKVCETRHFKPSERHDFIDLLLELAAKGKIKGECIEKYNSDGSPEIVELDFADPKIIEAQVYVLFLAGFETAATSTSYTLHQLAYHQDIQRKIQDEIDEVLSKYDNKLCYEAVAEMTLLQMAYQESLRLFPPAGLLRRVCSKKYTFPETNITIDPGVTIIIPIAAIHRDEKYFPNPYEFKPERFRAEAVEERDKYVYMPFGRGKRMCIGSRLGQMQSLTGLAVLLQRFNIEPAPQSRQEIKINRACRLAQGIDGGVPIKLLPRNRNSTTKI